MNLHPCSKAIGALLAADSPRRTRLSRQPILLVGLLACAVWLTPQSQAGNILVNPGFEADGAHGNGTPITAWNFSAGDTFWINVDSFAHSGNNYYKVWGQFNGGVNYDAVWQDNDCLNGSKYVADGWMETLSTDTMWSGDGLDYAWLEVTFRDAGGNILALYRSDIFSSTNYTTDTWYDFPITNICETNPPYNVIGSTNTLVAPAGTKTVRFQHTLYQALYGGGSVYFDDATLNQTGGPVPPVIQNVYPGNMLFASNQISFDIFSPSSTPINNSGIHLVVNGTDVSGGLNITGSSPNIHVSYNGLQSNVWAYSASITVTDTTPFSASASMKFDTVNPAFVWEAEDYDFTNGLYFNNPILSSTAQPNSYFGVTGTLATDYSSTATGQAHFRPNDTSGTGPAGDSARQNYLNAQLTDPAVIDWNVGYIGTGDWFNYTRDYPAGTYNVYGRLAGGAGATTVSLDDVGGGTNLGVFSFTGTDWGAYQYVPLVDTNGNLLPFVFTGKRTLRATLVSGGDNMNFFMLVPAQLGLPFLSNITPTNGSIMSTATAFSFTATSPVNINNSGIQLLINGADVSSHLSISGSATTKNVSCPLLTSNVLYTVTINVTNVNGVGVTRTVQFDTMSPNNFYVELEDFDYNGGQYDTANNGLFPLGYLAQNGGISNVDYLHISGGGYPYRSGLATEATSDFLLPAFVTAVIEPDYDIGNFNTGDWGNYTRNYPAGKYYVYARLAGYNESAYLDQVTSGLGTQNQALKRLGTWSGNSGGWQSWIWIPLTDAGLSSPVPVTLNGVSTLRVTSGGNCNARFFMLIPVTGIQISAAKSGGNVLVSFPTTAGASYRVFTKASLTSGNWTLVATVPGTGSTASVSVTPSSAQQLYQVTSP